METRVPIDRKYRVPPLSERKKEGWTEGGKENTKEERKLQISSHLEHHLGYLNNRETR